MNQRRRNFLKLSALLSSSTFFLPPVFAKSRRSSTEEPYWIPKIGRSAHTVCDECHSGCGIRVKRIEKTAVKVEGNATFPMNNGSLCPRGQSVLQSLYNPDRIKTPLLRDWARGSNQWKEIDWDSALDLAARKLNDLRLNNTSHHLAVLTGRRGEGTPYLLDRFMSSYGSPNLIWCPSLCNESVTKTLYLMEGNEDYKAYDLANTQYVLAFGDVLLQNPNCCMPLLNALKSLRSNRPGTRVKLLVIDSRLSNSGAKADEWIPVNPASEGALALAIAHVIIKEELYDRAFIQKHRADTGAATAGGARAAAARATNGTQPDLFAAAAPAAMVAATHTALSRLAALDVDALSPRQALELLYELRHLLDAGE